MGGGGDMNPGEMGGDEIYMTGKKRKVGIKVVEGGNNLKEKIHNSA